MNPTNIEWADWTWNPVTGCLNGCPYCYARDLAEGRLARIYGADGRPPFAPRFWPERLDAPAKKKKPGIVFVCSMGELLGDCVPWDWIKQIFEAMSTAPWHRYVLLTKNPKRLAQMAHDNQLWYLDSPNIIVGSSLTTDGMYKIHRKGVRVLWSVEPMTEPLSPSAVPDYLSWLLIGGRSAAGGLPAFKPPQEWIDPLVEWAREHGIPVLVKRNAGYPQVVEEFPEGWRDWQ